MKINFADFWPNFKKDDNYFYWLLSSRYDVEISEDPDILFFSVDYAHKRERDQYSCKKIFYTGENVRPNFGKADIDYGKYLVGPCDASLSFDESSNRNFRLPLWAFMINWFKRPYIEERDPAYLVPLEDMLERNFPVKKKFCNFLYSNPSGERMKLFDLISLVKRVDSPGILKNNLPPIGGRGDQKQKVDFQSEYKFTISAENAKYPGYVTEKILHPLSVGSIPIYWGCDLVTQDFNHKSFINANKLSRNELLEMVEWLDNNDRARLEMVAHFPFTELALLRVCPQRVLEFIEGVLC